MSEGRGGLIKLGTALVAALAAAALAAYASSGTARTGGVLAKPIDPRQQTLVEFGSRSHWLQPWRAYLDTVPARTLLDAIGVNFNVPPAEAAATAKLLASAGFRRARIEIPWGALEYENPSRLGNAEEVRTKLLAMKENGIRPLILLNAHDQKPTPLVRVSLRLAAPAQKGSRELQLEPASVAAVIPGRTGLNVAKGGGKRLLVGGALITDVRPDGRASLSQPLTSDLPAGEQKATTFLYPPFARPGLKKSGGASNPAAEVTVAGWVAYAGTVARAVKGMLGSEAFDVEIWNELTFGSAFLDIGEYYDPVPSWAGKGDIKNMILERTVAYLRDPANGVSTIGIGNGFANTLPWPSGEESPVGLTAIDKHPYPKVLQFPDELDQGGRGRPLNALGQRSNFQPSYIAFFPEFPLTAIRTETLVRDLSPVTTKVAKANHGRNTAPPGGNPVTMWITETNMNPKKVATTATAAQFGRLQAKATLRALVAYVNKGVKAVHFFAAKSAAFGLIRAGQGGGPTLNSLRRLVTAIGNVAPTLVPRPLSLLSVADTHNLAQFKGDGTAAHPPLYNRDVVAFFPFQASAKRYVVAAYVMTRNIAQVYKPSAPASDATRFDMPPGFYDVTIGGLGAGKWSFTMTDPVTQLPAKPTLLSLKNGRAVVRLPLTDSVRLLTISKP